jgi:hypothetical protein
MLGWKPGHLRERLQVLILYVVSVLSFLALVWAAISITRHIRRNSALPTATSEAPTESASRPASTPITLAGTRRNPVSTRSQSDWANLEKTIGGHDLGNTNYPRAAGRRNPPTQHSA